MNRFFIELKNVPTDQRYVVNVDNIEAMTETLKGPIIYLVSGGEVRVKESLDQISGLMQNMNR